jgi:hypothetical protein
LSQIQQQQKINRKRNKTQIEGILKEIYQRLVGGQNDREIMRALLLSERNYYKYKQKLSKKIEKYQFEKCESTIWLEVQTLKDRMSRLYTVVSERVSDPRIRSSDVSSLASTAQSIAINILKLESASISAIKQSNILESQVNTQLPSRSKYEELPRIINNNNNNKGASKDFEENNNNNTRRITYND